MSFSLKIVCWKKWTKLRKLNWCIIVQPLGQEAEVNLMDLIVSIEQPLVVAMWYGRTGSAGNRANRFENQWADQMKGQVRTPVEWAHVHTQLLDKHTDKQLGRNITHRRRTMRRRAINNWLRLWTNQKVVWLWCQDTAYWRTVFLVQYVPTALQDYAT